MNKIVAGAIAGAAGIALLLGGAGTFALWNSSASANAATISAGTLSLSAASAGSWTDVTNGRNASIDPSVVRMVPGNSYRFTQPLTVTATGQDLRANLTYSTASVTGDQALLAATTRTLQVTSTSATVAPASGADDTFVVSPSAASSTLQAVFTITLPQSATTGQNGALDLSGLTFTLSQTAIGS